MESPFVTDYAAQGGLRGHVKKGPHVGSIKGGVGFGFSPKTAVGAYKEANTKLKERFKRDSGK